MDPIQQYYFSKFIESINTLNLCSKNVDHEMQTKILADNIKATKDLVDSIQSTTETLLDRLRMLQDDALNVFVEKFPLFDMGKY